MELPWVLEQVAGGGPVVQHFAARLAEAPAVALVVLGLDLGLHVVFVGRRRRELPAREVRLRPVAERRPPLADRPRNLVEVVAQRLVVLVEPLCFRERVKLLRFRRVQLRSAYLRWG